MMAHMSAEVATSVAFGIAMLVIGILTMAMDRKKQQRQGNRPPLLYMPPLTYLCLVKMTKRCSCPRDTREHLQ